MSITGNSDNIFVNNANLKIASTLKQRPHTLEMSQIEAFLDLFNEIDFKINRNQNTELVISRNMHLSAEEELKKMLDKAKRDLSRMTKLYKKNKISSEELLEWEWRVHELNEEIKKVRELGDDIDDLEDYGLI